MKNLFIFVCVMFVPFLNAITPVHEKEGVIAPKPLFRDPIYDGAADPVVIWNPITEKWWMFYTNRRATETHLPGVSWVFGTPIGIAESADGAHWEYVGTAQFGNLPAEYGGENTTFWAPDIIKGEDGLWHMYLSVQPGIAERWLQVKGFMAHLTSEDLLHWKHQACLMHLGENTIDAHLIRMPDGIWRMYCKGQSPYTHVSVSESKDLYQWSDPVEVMKFRGEGAIVFHWKGYYWLILDAWRGQAVFRSADCNQWISQPGDYLMPYGSGTGTDDIPNALHANIIISNDRVYMYYFTHPGRIGEDREKDTYEQRRTSIQVVELELNKEGWLEADRNTPTYVHLIPPGSR